jgi:outer membrane protein W
VIRARLAAAAALAAALPAALPATGGAAPAGRPALAPVTEPAPTAPPALAPAAAAAATGALAPAREPAPTLTARAASPPAAPSRRFYFRAGGAIVKPLSTSRELELADVQGPATLAVQNGPIAGSGASVGSATILAASIGYVLPTASGRWSLEAVLGLPFTVQFEATGTLANMSLAPSALGLPTGVGPLGRTLGEAKAVPPVVTAVYQLRDAGVLRPYVGAGVSVLIALDPKVTNPILTAVTTPEMTIAPAPGVVVQAGVEARLSRSIYARLDAKFIGLMLARAEVHHVVVETPALPLFEHVEVGTAKLDVWVNPLIIQAGIGLDF